MKFKAEINVMPLKELLDPQGKAVALGMKNLNLTGIQDVRIGKHITLHLEAADRNEAVQKVETACKKLLANPVIEFFEYEVSEAE
ncbi:MAG: phosphoribosylformylglycinamidine synthase subunit PurS [Chitinophagales bacterium]|nr:MAG: phosphoribosylformylglycinamidine synthase subunit PurS [Chitinophagales bacterium]